MAGAGRPRSAQAREAVLGVALRIGRKEGYARLSMERIAREAAVGKQTVYRWWSSPAEVLLEAIRERAQAEIPVPDTGALRADLAGFLEATLASQRRTPGIDRVLRALMAEAQHDPLLARALRRDLIDPRRAVLRSIFERAHARGEIEDLGEVDLWLDVAFGVVWYRLLAGVGPRNAALAEKLAALLAREASGTAGGRCPGARGKRRS